MLPEICRILWHPPRCLPYLSGNRRLKKEAWLRLLRLVVPWAWQEWDIDQIEMAVPLSPDELMRKRGPYSKPVAKRQRLVSGNDKREFWYVQKEPQSCNAAAYNQLGLRSTRRWRPFVRYVFLVFFP